MKQTKNLPIQGVRKLYLYPGSVELDARLSETASPINDFSNRMVVFASTSGVIIDDQAAVAEVPREGRQFKAFVNNEWSLHFPITAATDIQNLFWKGSGPPGDPGPPGASIEGPAGRDGSAIVWVRDQFDPTFSTPPILSVPSSFSTSPGQGYDPGRNIWRATNTVFWTFNNTDGLADSPLDLKGIYPLDAGLFDSGYFHYEMTVLVSIVYSIGNRAAGVFSAAEFYLDFLSSDEKFSWTCNKRTTSIGTDNNFLVTERVIIRPMPSTVDPGLSVLQTQFDLSHIWRFIISNTSGEILSPDNISCSVTLESIKLY